MIDVDDGTTGGARERETADEDDRLDPAGWWQLAGLAVLGAVLPLAVSGLGTRPLPWFVVVGMAIVLAVVLPVAQLRTWWSRGGFGAVRATRGWVRAGRVPDDVPDALWRPRVRQFAADLLRRRISAWVSAALAVLWGVLAVTDRPGEWVIVAVWAVLAVTNSLRDRGGRAASDRLLTSARRPTTLPAVTD